MIQKKLTLFEPQTNLIYEPHLKCALQTPSNLIDDLQSISSAHFAQLLGEFGEVLDA